MSKTLNMEIKVLGGTVTFNSVSSIVYIIIDGEEVFRGPSCTLADILRKDKEYMEYISSHDVDGRPYDWKASE